MRGRKRTLRKLGGRSRKEEMPRRTREEKQSKRDVLGRLEMAKEEVAPGRKRTRKELIDAPGRKCARKGSRQGAVAQGRRRAREETRDKRDKQGRRLLVGGEG